MSVIKSDETLSRHIVKRERIIKAVGLLRRRHYLLDREPNPMLSRRVDNHHLAIQVEQTVETMVSPVMAHVLGYH